MSPYFISKISEETSQFELNEYYKSADSVSQHKQTKRRLN